MWSAVIHGGEQFLSVRRPAPLYSNFPLSESRAVCCRADCWARFDRAPRAAAAQTIAVKADHGVLERWEELPAGLTPRVSQLVARALRPLDVQRAFATEV